MSGVENATNFYEIVVATNELTNYYFGLFIIFLIFLVSFFVMKKYDTDSALIASSFITSIISAMFFFLELVSFTTLVIPFMFLIVAIFIKSFTN